MRGCRYPAVVVPMGSGPVARDASDNGPSRPASRIQLQDVGAKLSAVLPLVVDKLTPEGVLPKGNLLDQGMDFLKKQL